MFCKNCGKEVNDGSTFCPSCGANLDVTNESSSYGYGVNNQSAVTDLGSVGWVFLGLFFPLIGLILFLVWKDSKPVSSKQAGKGALIGVIVSVILGILSFVCMIIAASTGAR